jgi:hypothetical protein
MVYWMKAALIPSIINFRWSEYVKAKCTYSLSVHNELHSLFLDSGFNVEHLMDWQILEADEFFTNQKSVTSDHTLSRLHQPLVAEKQLHQLLGDMTLSHKQAVYNLCAEYTQFFTKWMFALRYKGIQFTYITKFGVICISFCKNSFITQDTVQVSYLTPL